MRKRTIVGVVLGLLLICPIWSQSIRIPIQVYEEILKVLKEGHSEVSTGLTGIKNDSEKLKEKSEELESITENQAESIKKSEDSIIVLQEGQKEQRQEQEKFKQVLSSLNESVTNIETKTISDIEGWAEEKTELQIRIDNQAGEIRLYQGVAIGGGVFALVALLVAIFK